MRREAARADGQDPMDEAASLQLQRHGLGGSQLWTHPGRESDGFALLRNGGLDLVVRPDARGQGLGGGLLARALSGPGAVVAWSHGNHPAAARLAETHGLDRVRDLWVMRRRFEDGAPLEPLEAPDDVRLRSWHDGDAEQLLALNAAAFADHPEQGAMDDDELGQRMAQDWFDPSGLIVAVDASSEQMLGFHWTKRHQAEQHSAGQHSAGQQGPDLGEVYVVAVDPAAQGRGMGRLVTLAGLHHLAERGCAQVLLYVESDNEAAVALYAGLGFEHAERDTHVMYRR